MMRRKNIYLCALGVLMSMLLYGCGDGSEENGGLTQEALTVTSEPLLSQTERAICDYELKYNTGTFELQDYHALADLYQEVGKIRKQRDMLEQGYRLYEDAETLEKLQQIAVNLAEEDDMILHEAELMLQNLELPEYLDESVNLISNGGWVRTMMPKLAEGRRNYFLQKDGNTVLTVQVGYDTAGKPYSNVWYVNAENQLTLLQYADATVKLMQTTMVDGSYDGTFEMWFVDSNTGNIRCEQGSFAKGVYSGDYSTSIHVGTESSDLFALWCNRQGMEYLTYTGSFDQQGRTTLEQPTEEDRAALIEGSDNAACVVYAYDESGQNCLFLGLAEGIEPATYSFDLSYMGVEAYPSFDVYEVQNAETDAGEQATASTGDAGQDHETNADEMTLADENAVQIRVFDGEIQYFNGYRWVSVGNAEQMAKKDPFYAYATKKEEFENGLWGSASSDGNGNNQTDAEDEGAVSDFDGTGGFGIGTITTPVSTATPTPTPAPTKNPTTSGITTPKPATTSKPTTTAKPVATPTPTPKPDNSGGASSSTPTPSTPIPSTPTPSTPTPSTPTPSTPTPSTPTPSTPTPSTPTPSTPTPSTPTPSTPEPSTPEPDTGGDSGDSGSDSGGSNDSGSGDVDIEWSPDIM